MIRTKINSRKVNYFDDLIIITNSGEKIKAEVFTKVVPVDSTPIKRDFAIISLSSKPKKYKLLNF